MKTRRKILALGIGIIALAAMTSPMSSAAELQNDGYVEGGSAAFQAGFAAGEIAAVRLIPAACPAQVQRIRFLFGGAAGSRDVILHVWDDPAGGTTPGNELFSARYSLTPSDTVLQEIALADSEVAVCGAFRVGIEVVAAGLPSIARDDDGTIDANRNFVLAQGFGWAGAVSLGITGDWVIRADVGFDPPFTSEVRNDGFVAGGSAGFQAGFATGEIGAVRLVPSLGPVTVERVRFLFGGDAGSRNVVVHIWDDSAEALAPGAELYAGTHPVVGFDTALQEIDLRGESITVAGPFRVGIEFVAEGLPSIARDADDSIDAARNFVFTATVGWVGAPTLGLTGDFVIRAVVVPEPDGVAVASLVALGCLARRRRAWVR